MRFCPKILGGRGNRALTVFSLCLLLLGFLALPNPRPSLANGPYTVNTTADHTPDGCQQPPDGDCTLREAIGAAQACNTIVFNIPHTDPNYGYHTPGVWTIILNSTLTGPSNDSVFVDGLQPDTNPYGPEIEISGEALDSGKTCWILEGSLIRIEGLVINRCPASGILIEGRHDNHICGNYIGTDATGTTDQGVGVDGILLQSGAHDNTIGGSSEAHRNIISGNSRGIRIAGEDTTANVIQGNYIGTDRTGTAPLGNDYGIQIDSTAHDNTIGPDNIIAYNDWYGVWVHGTDSTGNRITHNSIHSNRLEGIYLLLGGNNDLAPPDLDTASCLSVGGTTSMPRPTVEVFSDADGQGRFYEDGTLTWTDDFNFTFEPDSERLRGRMVTATATDSSGNTSPFSDPVHCGCPEIFLPLITKNY